MSVTAYCAQCDDPIAPGLGYRLSERVAPAEIRRGLHWNFCSPRCVALGVDVLYGDVTREAEEGTP